MLDGAPTSSSLAKPSSTTTWPIRRVEAAARERRQDARDVGDRRHVTVQVRDQQGQVLGEGTDSSPYVGWSRLYSESSAGRTFESSPWCADRANSGRAPADRPKRGAPTAPGRGRPAVDQPSAQRPAEVRTISPRSASGPEASSSSVAARPTRGFLYAVKTYVANSTTVLSATGLVVDANGQTLVGRHATRRCPARQTSSPSTPPRRYRWTSSSARPTRRRSRSPGNKRTGEKRYLPPLRLPRGGIKSRTLEEMLERRPEEVIRLAVKGMLPRNRLARKQLTKLKVYAGAEHPHAAQQPQPLEIKSPLGMSDADAAESAGRAGDHDAGGRRRGAGSRARSRR